MFQDLISLIFPQNCINCNTSLISSERYLCTTCKIDLPVTDDHLRPENQLYQKFAYEPKVKSAQSFIYFHHGGMAQKLLHQLKYQGKQDLGLELGHWFAPRLSSLSVDLVIPVPLHISKQRQRGFNQSELIARAICEELEWELRTDVIRRQRRTSSQTRKTKLSRWKNLQNVYSEASKDVEDCDVLIVDDVVTTGATVGMLCERLVAQRVRHIYIASIARGQ